MAQKFRVKIDRMDDGSTPLKSQKIILASLSGKIRRHSISITVGDTVRVQIFSSNLKEGIIVFRGQKQNKPHPNAKS